LTSHIKQLTAQTASGDVTAPRVEGAVTAKTASGDVEIGEAGSDVRANTASGDLRVETASRGTVSSKSASGSVSIGVATGTGVWLDLNTVSGSINNGLDTTATEPESRDLTIQVRTVSGDIDITRSRAATPV
ncbi:MAG: DUF4097 family beta strand repeat protein, partial [Chloroflexi bacterium]|nr:DUF4097 family beta strand repeat protein [Chloroflexota bacterium]